jgi:hypothetical protein
MRPAAAAAVAALALLAPACATDARAGDEVRSARAPPLLLEQGGPRAALVAPARLDGRMGAVQVPVRLRNDGPGPLAVIPDPWLAELAVRGEGGDVPCAPGTARVPEARSISLEPGASLPLRIDLSARCALPTPGGYDVEVSFPAIDAPTPRTTLRVEVAPRTWVNPGPR